ncbi:MAG: right-handed parallel beta-helix repeat-containing protein [Kiritimatiellae bacterium]|nr:right-handed parallel beta-helix repeat-containing protein [Kiritimatiellia bacterium]
MKKHIAIMLAAQVLCCAVAAKDYYLANKPGSGAGTLADPYGLADLPDPNVKRPTLEGCALEKLQPGDTLYFRAGTYALQTVPGPHYYIGYIRPARPGTSEQPITFAAYPGESVHLKKAGGGQKLLGSHKKDYVRYIGFTVHGPMIGYINGKGVEVGYCEVVGTFWDSGDNHDGIRIERADGAWIHHNHIHGVRGRSRGHVSHNSAGIKLYNTKNCIIEDNYIHGNSAGIFDKEAGIRNTFRRNYFAENEAQDFFGNNQGEVSTVTICDNVFSRPVNLHYLMTGTKVHDNLVLASRLCGAWAGKVRNTHIWNNIVLGDVSRMVGFYDNKSPLVLTGERPHFQYFDHNVYTASPGYSFDAYKTKQTFSLDQMRAEGFEKQAAVAGAEEIFVDRISWNLRPRWQTAGRYGDPVGPDDIARVLDKTRYGPAAGRRIESAARARGTP